MTRSLRVLASALACALVLVLTACAAHGPTYVDHGASYTESGTASVLSQADVGELNDAKTSDATRLRHDALSSLRSGGAAEARAADLITRVFPTDTRGVPVYVERARVGGVPALLVVEAIGPKNGRLTDKRLWVLDDQGSVLYSATR